MARRRATRRNRRLRLTPIQRTLFIVGATLYVVGVLTGIGLLEVSPGVAIALLSLGGGLQLAITLSLLL